MTRNQYIRIVATVTLVALVAFKPLTSTQRLILLVCAVGIAGTELIERKLFAS